MALAIELLEKNRLPDWLVRIGIRRLLAQRLREEGRPTPAELEAHKNRLVAGWQAGPVAIHTDSANAQHYEVPSRFFELVLGRHLKYSCCLFRDPSDDLDTAEEAMLDLYCERARLEDGQTILDLGCGWGSFTLHAAARFPGSRITALSNSRTQKAFIDDQCARRGLGNVRVITADIADCQLDMRVDRVVSVEMLEHVRNHAALFGRIRGWMRPGGLMFVHIFTHREVLYPFEVQGDFDWMAREFFTGGIMPSHDLLLRHQDALRPVQDWQVDGTHYQRTCEAWLARMDANRAAIEPLFAEAYGPREVVRWWARWRTFFMACAELFGYRGGTEWMVSHYLLENGA